jgi:arylsulfatase A-like enzyme
MKSFNLTHLGALVLLLLVTKYSAAQTYAPKNNKPNIIIILADDLGYSDLGCYGGEINTPSLDWLASQGTKLNSFYNASRCCPTRASLLTGLYPHTAGIGNMTTDQGEPGYRGSLKSNAVTIAQVLKTAGYQTGMVGKWHVSETKPFPTKEQQLQWLDHKITNKDFADTLSYPTHKGFDKYYGNIWGVVDYFDPFSLYKASTKCS